MAQLIGTAPIDTQITQLCTHNHSGGTRHRVVIECENNSLTKHVSVNGQEMANVESIQFEGFDADGIPMAIIRVAWPEVRVVDKDDSPG